MSQNLLKSIILVGALSAGCSTPKTSQQLTSSKADVANVMAMNERQQQILATLKQSASYDTTTNVSYIFAELPTDLETLGVAARNNIFFADPHTLIVSCDEGQKKVLEGQGYTLHSVANNVYEIQNINNIQAQKNIFSHTIGQNNVVYKYRMYTSSCSSFNDPQAYPQSSNQIHLFDQIRTDAGFNDPITHDIDSVASWESMHVSSTPTNPNIVVNIFDGGFDTNNPEFQGRVLWKYNFANGSSTTNPTSHGTNVAYLAAATRNNNYGGVGMYDGEIRLYQVSGDGVTIIVNDMYKALDSLIDHCQKNPTQRQINNFSLGSGNDPIFYAKIQTLYNMNNKKQNFFQGAAGNQGVASIVYPAAWPEFTAWGATNALDNNKTIWSGSNTGPELDFVNDGQNVKAMMTDGSFQNVTGTSFSTPLGTGTVANIVAQDTSRTNDDVRTLLIEGAKDLGTPGFDNTYGNGWARTGVTLKNAVVRNMPNSFNAGTTPSYKFIPKYYNGTKTSEEKCYLPNGTLAPVTINGNDQAIFTLDFTTGNGFVNGSNTITYEFKTSDGCTTRINKTFTISSVILPITLRDFNTQVVGKDVDCKWTTTSEINSDRFEVERSTNGTTFTDIGTVDATGNSGIQHTYDYLDHNVTSMFPGQTLFYRLKMIDKDGTYKYSAVNSVKLPTSPNAITVYPNPASNTITIASKSVKQVIIYDVQGKVVKSQGGNAMAEGGMRMDISSLSAGTYFVRIIQLDGVETKQKLVVQK